jgi:hypothetical protein
MRRAAVFTSAVLLVLMSACADPAGPNGKYCDVVKRVQATFDPMSKPDLYTEPTVLRAGMDLRVAAFEDLVKVAPPEVVGAATMVRDHLRSISNELRDRGDKSSAANDPAVIKLTNDKPFLEAQDNVARFSAAACKEPTPKTKSP